MRNLLKDPDGILHYHYVAPGRYGYEHGRRTLCEGVPAFDTMWLDAQLQNGTGEAKYATCLRCIAYENYEP